MLLNYAGIRNDIGNGIYLHNTYEANLCRIFQLEGKVFKYEKFEFEIDGEKHKIWFYDVDGLFCKDAYIDIKNYTNQDYLDKIDKIKDKYKINIIVISNEHGMLYSDLENKYKNMITLWESEERNIKKDPLLYAKEWLIGKRELKRKYPKFFRYNGKNHHTGHNWKHQRGFGYHGRPNVFGFCDLFKILDDDGTQLHEHENWGTILAEARHVMKLNPLKYFNTGKRISVWCRTKKTQEWYKIVEWDTMNNYWIKKEDLKIIKHS